MLRVWVVAAMMSGVAHGSVDLTLSALADDDGGSNLDAFVRWAPTDNLTLSAGLGRSDSSSRFSDFSGTFYSAGVGVHGRNIGARVAVRNWEDSNDFESLTTTGRLFWRFGAFETALLLEERELTVTYAFTPGASLRPIQREFDFSGDGFGLALSWFGDVWGIYAQYLDLDFDRRLFNGLSVVAQANSVRVTALSALAASVLTKSSGVTDYEISCGIDRAFARSGLRFDAYRLRDFVARGASTGLSASYRYTLNPRVELEGTLGGTDTEGFATLYYAALAVTFRN
ncbi:MAG: hypothetical protein NZM12_11665 [Steroidobacteraceae bacterium]|nr:hypothetical protein [Steroidobacteraceae bacterium]MDW8258073.1 hypothetical protein [Gammaproteobacteria bacterium]